MSSRLSDFYSIESWQAEAGRCEAALSFNALHPIFEGHFPEQPVVPGVCTMAIVKALLEKAFGYSLSLKEASQIKFLGLLTPDTCPHAALSWSEAEGTIKVSATLQLSAVFVFKMNAFYEPAISN